MPMNDGVLPLPGNPIEAVTHVDPYPYYRQLREQRPLYFDEGLKLWVASSHAVIDEAFHNVALRVRPPAEPVPQALLGTAAGEVFAQLVRMTDGEFHAAHKPAVEQAARRWSLADVAQASEAAARDLFAAGPPQGKHSPLGGQRSVGALPAAGPPQGKHSPLGGQRSVGALPAAGPPQGKHGPLGGQRSVGAKFRCLTVNDFMGALPVQAMARLLGLTDGLLDDSCRWVRQFVQGIAPGALAQAVALAAGAAEALMDQGRALGLSTVQAANRIAFMQQSLDATAGLMGHTVLMLAQHPDLALLAGQSPQAMRGFVAEVERHQAPIQNTRRFAADPVVLAGQSIEAGQGVLLVLASANRDEAFNPQPDSFDPQRGERRSMGFGAGAHACPGAAIAIEIVAACIRWMRSTGQFDGCFGAQAGFWPLANARLPVFET